MDRGPAAPVNLLLAGVGAGASLPLLAAGTTAAGMPVWLRLVSVVTVSGFLFLAGLAKVAAAGSPRAYTGFVGAYALGASCGMVLVGVEAGASAGRLLAFAPGLLVGLALVLWAGRAK